MKDNFEKNWRERFRIKKIWVLIFNVFPMVLMKNYFVCIQKRERRKWLLNCSLSLGAICGGVLQDPLQAPTCEHAFCGVGKKCVFVWLIICSCWSRFASMNGLHVYKHVRLIVCQSNLINWNQFHEFWKIYFVGRRLFLLISIYKREMFVYW